MNGSVLTGKRSLPAPWLVLTAFLLGISLFAQGQSDSSPSSEKQQTVVLQYRELPFSYYSKPSELALLNTPFLKEPSGLSQKVHRGNMMLGTDKGLAYPFIWDFKQRLLYLDPNRNQDFGDAGTHRYQATPLRASDYHQVFTNVQLVVPASSGSHLALVDLTFYQHNAHPSIYMAFRSIWEGRIILQGQEWHLGYIENGLGDAASTQGFLLLRPWEEREKDFSLHAATTSLDAFAFSRNLFFNSQAYQVDGQFIQQENMPQYMMRWREKPAELGPLHLKGKFIDRLVLNKPAQKSVGIEAMKVVLHQPPSIIKVPIGPYGESQVHLKAGLAEANPEVGRTSTLMSAFAVEASSSTNLTSLEIGGPLTNSVQLQSQGRTLRLSYCLLGAAGSTYQLLHQDRANPPRFTITKNGKVVHSGKFEYG